MLVRADPGTEKFIPWAKAKLKQWKDEMLRTGQHALQRTVFVDDNTTKIYITSLYLGHGQFSDSVRITGGISGRFVWGNTDEPADKWVFFAGLDGGVSSEVYIDDVDAAYIDCSKDRSTVVSINPVTAVATLYRGGEEFTVTDVGTFWRSHAGTEFNAVIGTEPFLDSAVPVSWYRRKHVAMSRDGKTVYLCSADDTNLIVKAIWNAADATFDVTRVAVPTEIQDFMDGASGVTWDTPWFSGRYGAGSTDIASLFPAEFNYNTAEGPPGTYNVGVQTPLPRFFPNPHRAEVWMSMRMAYVNSEVTEHSTGAPAATLRRFSGEQIHQVWRYDSDGWALVNEFPTAVFERIVADDTTSFLVPLERPTMEHSVEGINRDYVLFEPDTKDGHWFRWPLTAVERQTATYSNLIPTSGPVVISPQVDEVPTSSNLLETTIYRDNEEWWTGIPCDIAETHGLVKFLSLGADGRALVKASGAGGFSVARFYWRYLNADGEVAYLDFANADLATGAQQVPNGAFLSRSGRMLFGNKVYKDGEIIYDENLFAVSFGSDPVVRTSFANDGHWQYMVAGTPARPAVSRLAYNAESEVWEPRIVRYLPYEFDKVTDRVITPEVPGETPTGADLALEVAYLFGLDDTADMASYSGVSQGVWEDAAQDYIDGSKGALLALMYDVFILQYIDFLGGGVTIDDVLEDYYGEPGHLEPELQAEMAAEHEADVDPILSGMGGGTPAEYAIINIDTYDSFWLDEFVP